MMKKTKHVLVLGALMAMSACGGATIGLPSTQSALLPNAENGLTTAPLSVTPDDASFARLLNAYRDNNNAGAVAHDARLDAAAQDHADDMARNNYFSHTGLDGSTTLERIRASGYVPRAYGENLAGRQQSENEALRAWINSPSHDRVLKAETFEDFGFAVAGTGSRTRWVLIMGRE